MGITLNAKNYDISGQEYTQIATAIAIGGTTLVVDNTTGFSSNDYIVLGDRGSETCEIVKIASVTNITTLTIGAAVFAHEVDDPVYKIPFNQVRFYSCATQTGTFALITTEDADVDNINWKTSYYHSAGTTTTWYKYTYYNETTTAETAIADSTAVIGAYNFYCTIQDVGAYLGIDIDDNTAPSASAVRDIIEYVSDEIDNQLNTSFRSNTIPATDYEYIDGVGGKQTIEGETFYQATYFLKHTPIITVDDLDVCLNPDTTDAASETWTNLTEITDYYVDKDTGRIRIVTPGYVPPKGNKRIRVAYTWGRSAVPTDIRKLAVLMTIRDLMKGNIGRSLIQGRDEFDATQFTALDRDIEKIMKSYQVYKMDIIM